MKQSQLAARTGTSGTTICRVIAGKTGLSVELAEHIAAITGVRAGWLLTGELPMRRGQDLNAVAEASYLKGWRDAVANVEHQLREIAKRGLVRPRAAPQAPRRKRS